MAEQYDVIVIGAGHAGCEAAYAAARLGRRVAICTLSDETVAHMPCNPAIGGTAKGHLVAEIDALGGLMARAIDATGIQFKVLNRSRGPAVWSPRAQADKKRYGEWMLAALRAEKNIEWIFGRAGEILVEHGRVTGLALEDGPRYACDALVITTGTFLNGLVHVGPEQRPAGRANEPPSRELAESLKSFGFTCGRLKTGTPPRLDRHSIDFDRGVADGSFALEPGDNPPVPFSFLTESIDVEQTPCYLAHTNDRVREIVLANIDKSPLFNGQIQGIGPRYCPSLEDKIVRFPQRERHQIYLEPEGRRRRRDLPQRLFDEPARGRAARDCARDARARKRADAASGVRGGVRLHSADRADQRARDETRAWAVSCRSNQRDVGLRGSGCPGTRCRDQRRAAGDASRSRSYSAGVRPISELW